MFKVFASKGANSVLAKAAPSDGLSFRAEKDGHKSVSSSDKWAPGMLWEDDAGPG